MQDQAKNLAETLRRALQQKGIELSTGASLDVASQLLGTKDWNALSAVVSQRRDCGQLQRAVRGLLDAMAKLANNAGDVPEWNRGGFAYEACQVGKRALRNLPPQTEPVQPQAATGSVSVEGLSAFVRDLAATPLDGEFCADAPDGLQCWDDKPSLYNKLEELTLNARNLLHPERSRLQHQLIEEIRQSKDYQDVLDELVLDLSECYAFEVADASSSSRAMSQAFETWESVASDINNQGPFEQVLFLMQGYGIEEAQKKIREALRQALDNG